MSAGPRRLAPVAAALCAVLLPVLGAPGTASATSTVDLQLYYDTPVIAPGGTGTQTFGVADAGADGTAAAELDLALPPFTRLAAGAPAACQIRYHDTDPAVPEILRCGLGVPQAGQTVTLALPLTVDAAAPRGSIWGSAVAVAGSPAPDIGLDANPADNLGPISVVVGGGSAAARTATGGSADLYVSTDLPPLAPDAPGTEHLTIGNRGPDAMSGPAELVLTPPPLVRIDPDRPLPPGCAFRYDDPDPLLPQVVRCVLPWRLLPGWQEIAAVPMSVLAGAPVQTVWGTAGVYPDRADGSTDTDPLPQNNLVESGAQIVG